MKFKLRRYYLYYFGRVAALIFTIIPLKIGLAIASGLGEEDMCSTIKVLEGLARVEVEAM